MYPLAVIACMSGLSFPSRRQGEASASCCSDHCRCQPGGTMQARGERVVASRVAMGTRRRDRLNEKGCC